PGRARQVRRPLAGLDGVDGAAARAPVAEGRDRPRGPRRARRRESAHKPKRAPRKPRQEALTASVDWLTRNGRFPHPSSLRTVTNLALLEIKNLRVAIEDGTEIVKGVDLAVNPDEVHAIMGPNGSGKSTLAYALMGHPAYEITGGEILFDGRNLLPMSP